MATNFHFSSQFKKSPESKKKTKKFFSFLWNFLKSYGLMLLAIFIIFLIAVFAWFSRGLPSPDKIMEREVAQSTKIYERNGETVLYDIHGDEKRTLIKLEDLPDYVKQATIATEDRYFYEHKGFNVFAMFKGVIIDPLLGRRARGGSTLTQQLVKNAILTNERKVSRKIREFILSYRIEQKFSKDEILQMYLNEIPYGSTSYGIESAAQTYFGKSAKDLSLAQAALLAALPQAPTYYSPYGSNVEALLARKNYVLDSMVETEYITVEQATQAKQEVLEFKQKRESILAPHFVMHVRQQLAEMFGDKMVEQGGLKVITTLDLDKQKIAEEAVAKGVESRSVQYGFKNAALLAMDAATGEIIAMVGSKDYFDDEIDGKVNVTTRLRQPGSSIKPLVYTAAFQRGYTPDTILYDVNTKFKTDTKDYEPKNYDLVEHGPVTMRKALQGSLNIPAVKTLYLAGYDNVINFLELLGYTSFGDRSRFGLSLVLGGGEVTLYEHVAAYNVFPNEGIYRQPETILRVEDASGNVLYEAKKQERKVLDKKIANITNNVLSDNEARTYVFGANNYLVLDRPAGAKTGTTNDYRDAWTVGYTPQITAGVWVGNNDNSEMKRGADGSVIAAPIWNDFMRRAHEGLEVKGFSGYEKETTGKAVLDGIFANEITLKIDKFSGKIATEYTPNTAIEEKTYKEIHNILHYVNRNDPRGPIPNDLGQDYQYAGWEVAVQDWLTRQKNNPDPVIAEKFNFVNEAPPTEYDDLHLPEYQPTVFLQTPQNNQTITTENIVAQVNVSAPRGISRVEYYLDNFLIKTIKVPLFDLNTPISSIFVNGYHRFKVVAYDDVDNNSQVEVDINILSERSAPTLNWYNISQSYSLTQSPLSLATRISDLVAVKKIDFYYRPAGQGEFQLYSSVIAPTDNVAISSLTLSQAGSYELRAVAILGTGTNLSSETININVLQ